MIGKDIILVTGSCGFIGSNLISKLLENESNIIIGIDNMNSYYDVKLKYENLNRNKNDRYVNYCIDISDIIEVNKIFNEWNFTKVYHLAAQAGVRYSINYPNEIMNSNIFQNLFMHHLVLFMEI